MADVFRSGGRPIPPLLLLAAAGAAGVLFLISSLAAFSQTDFMYVVVPAVLRQNGALYTDVPFPQAPLSVLLYSLLTHLTGSVNIFVPARLSALVCVVAAVLLDIALLLCAAVAVLTLLFSAVVDEAIVLPLLTGALAPVVASVLLC